MKWSKLFLHTLKDAPAEAEIPSHKLLARADLIRKVGPGLYTYGTLALRSIRKFERILREELDKRGCQEILMPIVQPQSLWEESGRWTAMGEGLLKFENRNQHKFCLGATHEEVVTDYVRKAVESYRDLPVTLYQIQTKYRDEIRPRFGLMRGREFIMKDAYSFDVDPAAALKSYSVMYDAYRAIFDRLGLRYRIVEADAGAIGGTQTHEFQLLADVGEDGLMVCDRCDFAANVEVAPALNSDAPAAPHSDAPAAPPTDAPAALGPALERPLEAFPTPGLKAISTLSKALNVPASELIKTMFYSSNDGTDPKDAELRPVAVLLRGSDEVNPIKLKNALGLSNEPPLLSDEAVFKATGAHPGSCGPVGLKMPIILDSALEHRDGFIVGANRDGEHMRNVRKGRDFTVAKMADVRTAKEGDLCPKCREGHYKAMRGIEVGHVFYLGTKYSKSMSATFLKADGAAAPIEMGCYGIGVSRTIQASIEQSHDKDGIIWPMAIAPFHVHVVVLDPENEEVATAAAIVTRELESRGVEVFVDDRVERPGVKFKDADLLGFPLRLNVGARGLQSGEIELIPRRSRAMEKAKAEVAAEAAIARLQSLGWKP